MRIYCLVTCFNPLTVWIYRSGFARFSNFRFSMKRSVENPCNCVRVNEITSVWE
jgi:tubulin polyglutamylase TTLL9